MNKNTQVQRIDAYCREHNNQITAKDAYIKLGIMRLASRISDMNRLGYWIKSEMIQVENADGSKSHVALYTILKYLDSEVSTNA